MVSTKAKYSSTTIEVYKAGTRRFMVKTGDGTGTGYLLNRALGKLVRRAGASIENTGHGAVKYVTLPEYSKATGKTCNGITEQALADFIANS